jgi:hypothetical protein
MGLAVLTYHELHSTLQIPLTLSGAVAIVLGLTGISTVLWLHARSGAFRHGPFDIDVPVVISTPMLLALGTVATLLLGGCAASAGRMLLRRHTGTTIARQPG